MTIWHLIIYHIIYNNQYYLFRNVILSTLTTVLTFDFHKSVYFREYCVVWPATYLFLSEGKNWILNTKCRGIYTVHDLSSDEVVRVTDLVEWSNYTIFLYFHRWYEMENIHCSWNIVLTSFKGYQIKQNTCWKRLGELNCFITSPLFQKSQTTKTLEWLKRLFSKRLFFLSHVSI